MNQLIKHCIEIKLTIFVDEDLDIVFDGDQLMWHHLDSETFDASHFRYWPSDIISQFPMKGIKFFDESSKTVASLNLLRTSLVFMIRSKDSTHEDYELDEWKFSNNEGPYFVWTNDNARLYRRLMLPGTYKIYDQAIYLFASSGKLCNGY